MERKIIIDKLKEIKLIAHRLGYQMTNYPENSIEVLNTIFANKELLDSCYGFEFDICFTKDHIPVVVHDKYIDDISDNTGLIKEYSLEELKNIEFKFRKSSIDNTNNSTYKIVTLKELLTLFENNIELLNDKVIKIETKDYIFTSKNNLSKKDLKVFAQILNEFPKLSKNIIHLSFWPLNLSCLKKIQKINNYQLIESDLLCDYNIIVFLTKFMPFLDNISLRIKTKKLPNENINNSKKVNKKIKSDLFWMNFANAINEKNLKYAIEKYGTVGLYTLNDYSEMEELCKHISDEFFINNSQKIIITTNNPLYFKRIK